MQFLTLDDDMITDEAFNRPISASHSCTIAIRQQSEAIRMQSLAQREKARAYRRMAHTIRTRIDNR